MFIKLGAELSNPERELISKNLHKLHRLYLNILHPPILCLCFLCSVIWSRRSASCEDSCCTSFCVWSSCTKTELASNGPTFTRDYHLAPPPTCPWSVFHSFCSPSTSSTAREMARSLGNQSRHLSCTQTFNFQCLIMSSSNICDKDSKVDH